MNTSDTDVDRKAKAKKLTSFIVGMTARRAAPVVAAWLGMCSATSAQKEETVTMIIEGAIAIVLLIWSYWDGFRSQNKGPVK